METNCYKKSRDKFPKLSDSKAYFLVHKFENYSRKKHGLLLKLFAAKLNSGNYQDIVMVNLLKNNKN